MKVAETLIDGDPERYEQRYSVFLRHVELKFVRRPVSIVPPDGTLCYVDDGPRLGKIPRQGVGVFKDGGWTNGKRGKLRFEPTHWVHWEDLPDGT